MSTFAGTSTHLEVLVEDQALKVAVYGTGRFDYLGSVGREVHPQLSRCAVIRTRGDGA